MKFVSFGAFLIYVLAAGQAALALPAEAVEVSMDTLIKSVYATQSLTQVSVSAT